MENETGSKRKSGDLIKLPEPGSLGLLLMAAIGTGSEFADIDVVQNTTSNDAIIDA